MLRGGVEHAFDLGPALRFGQEREVDPFEPRVYMSVHARYDRAVLFVEGRAQLLVAIEEFAVGALERAHAERTEQPHGGRGVAHAGRRKELVREVEALLHERQSVVRRFEIVFGREL